MEPGEQLEPDVFQSRSLGFLYLEKVKHRNEQISHGFPSFCNHVHLQGLWLPCNEAGVDTGLLLHPVLCTPIAGAGQGERSVAQAQGTEHGTRTKINAKRM